MLFQYTNVNLLAHAFRAQASFSISVSLLLIRDYRERGESRARAQHDILVKILEKVAGNAEEGENSGWKIKLIVFVGGTFIEHVDPCTYKHSTTISRNLGSSNRKEMLSKKNLFMSCSTHKMRFCARAFDHAVTRFNLLSHHLYVILEVRVVHCRHSGVSCRALSLSSTERRPPTSTPRRSSRTPRPAPCTRSPRTPTTVPTTPPRTTTGAAPATSGTTSTTAPKRCAVCASLAVAGEYAGAWRETLPRTRCL